MRFMVRRKFNLPNFSAPMANSTQPERNASMIANSGGLSCVYCIVSNAIKLVGPIDTSLTVPKNTYTSDPIDDAREKSTINRMKGGKIGAKRQNSHPWTLHTSHTVTVTMPVPHTQLPEELWSNLMWCPRWSPTRLYSDRSSVSMSIYRFVCRSFPSNFCALSIELLAVAVELVAFHCSRHEYVISPTQNPFHLPLKKKTTKQKQDKRKWNAEQKLR